MLSGCIGFSGWESFIQEEERCGYLRGTISGSDYWEYMVK